MKCSICNHTINDPICLGCLIEEIKSLLVDKKEFNLINELEKLKKSFIDNSSNFTCINCKGNVFICKYCALAIIRDFLYDIEIKNIIDEIYKLDFML